MKIYAKLFAVKSEIGKISKDSNNPFFKSKYFDINGLLENVEPLLHKNGLVLLQPIENNKVVSRIIDIETAETVESSIDLPNITDPQKLGSCITYYRRYSLGGLLSVQAEDDDGNSIKKPSPKKQNTAVVPTDEINRISKELEKVTDLAGYEALKKKEFNVVSSHPNLKAMFSGKLIQLQKVTANGNA